MQLATKVTVNFSSPAFLVLDNNDYLVTYNDTLVYMTHWIGGTSVYQISFNKSWTVEPLPATNTSTSGLIPAQVTWDSCGRMWVVVYGYGVRVYDAMGSTLLASWAVSTTLTAILLLDNYDLYLADYDNDKILYYKPSFQ
ncbi:unnamed protein product, partial [Didymodactylos carnosus]